MRQASFAEQRHHLLAPFVQQLQQHHPLRVPQVLKPQTARTVLSE